MSGKVDRHERAVERQRDRVPRVRVLRAAVEEHELGVALPPDERAQVPSAFDRDLLAANVGGAVVREAELLGVLVEQRELVVRDAVRRLPCRAPYFSRDA